jgi:hypothetical protein
VCEALDLILSSAKIKNKKNLKRIGNRFWKRSLHTHVH